MKLGHCKNNSNPYPRDMCNRSVFIMIVCEFYYEKSRNIRINVKLPLLNFRTIAAESSDLQVVVYIVVLCAAVKSLRTSTVLWHARMPENTVKSWLKLLFSFDFFVYITLDVMKYMDRISVRVH